MIRAATIDDVDQIANLEYRLFPNSMPPAMLERELGVGQGFVIGSPIVGYVLLRAEGERLDVTRIGVDPDMQGQKLGTKLLEHAIALGKPMQLAVLKNNEPALRLYLKYGFQIVAQVDAEHTFAGEAAWVMRRPTL